MLAKRDVFSMTKTEFANIECEHNYKGEFDSLVIIPTRRKHDSGFRCLEFVAVKDGVPVYRFGGCSDVVHIDGIGGYGDWVRLGSIPKSLKPKAWSIDCLPCGYLRLFSSNSRLHTDEFIGSDCCVYAGMAK